MHIETAQQSIRRTKRITDIVGMTACVLVSSLGAQAEQTEKPASGSTALTTAIPDGIPHSIVVEYQEDDATEKLQAALDSGAATVRIPYVGKPWITRPLSIRSKTKLTLDPGVVLMAKKGAYKDVHDCVLSAERVQEIGIYGGPGARIQMHKDDYLDQSAYEKSEWRHCIRLRGVNRAYIHGLSLVSSGGDGLYVGPTWDDDRVPCSNIKAFEIDYIDNTRQGLTVVAATSSHFGASRVSLTGGRAPQAAIDIEPSSPSDPIDVELMDWHISTNEGSGLLIVLDRTDPDSRISVKASQFYISGTRQAAVRMKSAGARSAAGRVSLSNFVIEDISHEGLKLENWNLGTNYDVVLDRIVMSDVGQDVPTPISFGFIGDSMGRGTLLIGDSVLYDQGAREKVNASINGDMPAPLIGRLEVVTNAVPAASLPWAQAFAINYR
ncbi:MAG: hypothetical protein ACPGXK_00125 [Phycisphaerae bacterium]